MKLIFRAFNCPRCQYLNIVPMNDSQICRIQHCGKCHQLTVINLRPDCDRCNDKPFCLGCIDVTKGCEEVDDPNDKDQILTSSLQYVFNAHENIK